MWRRIGALKRMFVAVVWKVYALKTIFQCKLSNTEYYIAMINKSNFFNQIETILLRDLKSVKMSSLFRRSSELSQTKVGLDEA
jgi:hypothetical protein